MADTTNIPVLHKSRWKKYFNGLLGDIVTPYGLNIILKNKPAFIIRNDSNIVRCNLIKIVARDNTREIDIGSIEYFTQNRKCIIDDIHHLSLKFFNKSFKINVDSDTEFSNLSEEIYNFLIKEDSIRNYIDIIITDYNRIRQYNILGEIRTGLLLLASVSTSNEKANLTNIKHMKRLYREDILKARVIFTVGISRPLSCGGAAKLVVYLKLYIWESGNTSYIITQGTKNIFFYNIYETMFFVEKNFTKWYSS